jgi:hypothetical protein
MGKLVVPNRETRLKLMAAFREDMKKIEPERDPKDIHPSFKLNELVFKYEHSNFLFKVWSAGRNTGTVDEERKKFEEQIQYRQFLKRHKDGTYELEWVEGRWQGWLMHADLESVRTIS